MTTLKPLYLASGLFVILSLVGVPYLYFQHVIGQSRTGGQPLENGDPFRGWREAETRWRAQESKERPLVNGGRQALTKGRYDEAEGLFRKALAIQPQDAETWLLLADVCEKQGKQTAALNAYHELVYSNQKGWGSSINSHPTTRMKYVLALTRANRWQEAVAVYDMAITSSIQTNGRPMVEERFDPARRDLTRLQAVAHAILSSTGPSWGPPNTADQKKHLDAALKLHPEMPLIQYLHGRSLEKEGHKAEAAAAYQKAESRAGGDLKATVHTAYQRVAQVSGSVGARP